MRMAATNRVVPIDSAPERPAIDLFATLGPDGLARSLARVGASTADAVQAAALVRAAAPRLAPGTSISLRLGKRDAAGRRPVERLALRASMDLKLAIERGGVDGLGGLAMTRIAVPVTTTPLQGARSRRGRAILGASYRGRLDRSRDLLSQGPGGGDRRRRDRARCPLRPGRRQPPQRRRSGAEGDLLYAGIDRMIDRDLKLVRWTAGGRPVWVDAITIGQAPRATEGLAWPVSARDHLGLRPAHPPDPALRPDAQGDRFRRALGHADPRRRRRPGGARRLGRGLWPAGADRRTPAASRRVTAT